MAFPDIPIRVNGKGNIIFGSWFNTIRAELINAFGSGGYIKEQTPEVLGNGGQITLDPVAFKPLAMISGGGGAVILSSTPFGTGHGFTGGKEIILLGLDDVNTVTLEVNDIDEGIISNGKIVLTRFDQVILIYNENLKRFIRKE